MFSTVKAKLWLIVFALTATMIFLGFYSYSALSTLKVGGPVYHRIVDSMNLRADILPPPQYLIETELTVYQLVNQVLAGNGNTGYHNAEWKLMQLRHQFEEGQTAWNKSLPAATELDKEIRMALLQRNAKLCRGYFALVFTEFLPAVKNGNRVRMLEVLNGPLAETANQHRAAINELTGLTEKSSHLGESSAADIVASRIRVAVGLALCLMIVAFGAAVLLVRSITSPLDVAIRTLDKFAQGDLTVSANNAASGEMGKMCDALNRAIESLREVISSAVRSADSLGQFSHTLSQVSQTVSGDIEEQVGSLKETASNIALIAELSANNSAGTSQGMDSAQRTRVAADNGAEMAKAAISGMSEIQQSSAQINQIVDTVDEISFYTNLLAVNAAVEAARAGEQGRGFMIVAQEIRTLAQRTAKASGSIRQLVEKSQSAIAEGAERVQQSSLSFNAVSTAVRELTAIIEDVSSSITVQSESLKQMNDVVSDMAQRVSKSTQGPAKLGLTSRDLAAEAQSMHKLVEFFKV